MGIGRRLCRVLDPVLVPAGFTAGQGSEESDHGQPVGITYCTGHDEFSDRYPWLPQANQYQRDERLCIDFVIGVHTNGITDRIDLEDLTLEETLRCLGRSVDADACGDLIGDGYAAAIEVLPGVLRRLLHGEPR